MWRVSYRLQGADEEWQAFDAEHDAREFLAGLLDSDRHSLIVDTILEEWDGDRWAARH